MREWSKLKVRQRERARVAEISYKKDRHTHTHTKAHREKLELSKLSFIASQRSRKDTTAKKKRCIMCVILATNVDFSWAICVFCFCNTQRTQFGLSYGVNMPSTESNVTKLNGTKMKIEFWLCFNYAINRREIGDWWWSGNCVCVVYTTRIYGGRCIFIWFNWALNLMGLCFCKSATNTFDSLLFFVFVFFRCFSFGPYSTSFAAGAFVHANMV